MLDPVCSFRLRFGRYNKLQNVLYFMGMEYHPSITCTTCFTTGMSRLYILLSSEIQVMFSLLLNTYVLKRSPLHTWIHPWFA